MKKRQRTGFTPLQAQRINQALRAVGAEYLFIGKSGAILLGYPSTTQDVDLFLPKSLVNARKVIRALRRLGFRIGPVLRQAILTGKDFVQIKTGPFDLDLIHAPDGIPSFGQAQSRSVNYRGFPVASLRDIIASKRASNRAKDLIDLELLEDFRREYERLHAPAVETALDKVMRRHRAKTRSRD